MKIIGEDGLGNILKKFLQVCFVLGIVILILLPFLLKDFGVSLNASFLIIYPNGIVLLVIVKKFIELFRSLKDNNPFCDKNVKILKFTGNSALVGAILWLLDLIYAIVLVKISDIVIIMFLAFLFVLFLGVSIALYILSELLKEATEYKKENELTI